MNNRPAAFHRYVPLACWVAVVLTALFIGLKVISYGLLPPGDARRHVAMPFAGRHYRDIAILRPEYVVDHSPGWEWLLGVLHRTFGWDEDDLMSFSIVSLILWVFCLPLIWMRHPEAWLAAILAEMIAIPELMTRFTQARPYLVTEGVYIALLLAWSKETKSAPWSKLILTTAGFALAIWMHGIWYFWGFLLAGFFLAQRWRDCFRLAACWLVGALVAGLLTGKPYSFLYEAVFQAYIMYAEHLPGWMVVGELQPSQGEFASLILLTLVYIWVKQNNRLKRPLFHEPVFWMIALGWTLGLMADRFWADWGMPAALVWMGTQFDDAEPRAVGENSFRRLLLCGLIAVPLYLDATTDLGQRYTFSNADRATFLDASDPKTQGWFPDKGGIFYADNMKFFFDTFYKNPRGDWRYMVGFEPGLMPPDDRAIYREIQRSGHASESYEPWVKKMRPADRLAIEGFSHPDLPALEWKQIGKYWIGRLPRNAAPASEH